MNWIEAIGIAVLSSLVTVLVTVATNRTNKLLNKASARIEWIQNVRRETAKLLSGYHGLLQESSIKKKYEWLLKSRENTNLLILYFGPEKSTTVELLDEQTNEGKNEGIVTHLNKLFEEFTYLMLYIQETRRELEKELPSEVFEEHKDQIFSADRSTLYLGYYDDADKLEKKLTELSEIMRIYLKLEWNIAKKGK